MNEVANAEPADVEIRPGVRRPDWSVVTLPAAGEALRARSSSRSGLIDCWLVALNPAEDLVWRRALVLFADLGRAPRTAEIAADARLGEESVGHILKTLQHHDLVGLFEGDGRIVTAYPFTDRTTGHIVNLGARRLNALCAIDALGAGAMHQRDAVVESRCRVCAGPIRIATADLGRAVSTISPPETVVWYDTSYDGSAASSCCTRIAFFCSDGHLNGWLRASGGRSGRRLSVEEALQVGRALFAPVLAEATAPREEKSERRRIAQV
ncbi:alkylmercury lyase family protein [Mesorhizobium sp. AaZ16]|uniref:alkylmercury lyase family protein n=1 Tax=Mesorhizobium sp. AaZ16 TaxID=3402289 RepID=UPI00374E38B7